MFATFFGQPELLNEQAEKYHAVSAKQVNEFARSSLGSDNRASLLFVPKSENSEKAAA
jgi:hypothetical protein